MSSEPPTDSYELIVCLDTADDSLDVTEDHGPYCVGLGGDECKQALRRMRDAIDKVLGDTWRDQVEDQCVMRPVFARARAEGS